MIKNITYAKNGIIIPFEEVPNQTGEVSKVTHFLGTNGDGNGMVMLTSLINLDDMSKEEITAMLVAERMGHGSDT
jgi:hypothetical protein